MEQQIQALTNKDLPSLLAVIPYDQAIHALSKQQSTHNELALIDFHTLCAMASQLLTTAPGLIDWKNKDCEFLGCNYSVAKIASINSPEDIIGKNDEDFTWGKNGHAELIRQVDKEALKGQIIFDICKVQHPDKQRLLFAKKVPLITKQNCIVGVLDYLTEIDDSSIISILSHLEKLNIKITSDVIAIAKKYAVKDNMHLLSERQKECLYYLLRGATAKEIAKKLDLSFRTIEDYIELIKDKFQCSSKTSLIEKAINFGYINILPESLIIAKFIKEKL